MKGSRPYDHKKIRPPPGRAGLCAFAMDYMAAARSWPIRANTMVVSCHRGWPIPPVSAPAARRRRRSTEGQPEPTPPPLTHRHWSGERHHGDRAGARGPTSRPRRVSIPASPPPARGPAKIKARILVCIGATPRSFRPAARSFRGETEMKGSGQGNGDWRLQLYDGAGHSFTKSRSRCGAA